MKLFAVEMDYLARDALDLDYHGRRYYVIADDATSAAAKVREHRTRDDDHHPDAKIVRTINLGTYIP